MTYTKIIPFINHLASVSLNASKYLYFMLLHRTDILVFQKILVMTSKSQNKSNVHNYPCLLSSVTAETDYLTQLRYFQLRHPGQLILGAYFIKKKCEHCFHSDRMWQQCHTYQMTVFHKQTNSQLSYAHEGVTSLF